MRIIDLTQPLYTAMPVYPGDPKVKITPIQTIEKEGWRLSHLEMGSHTGTHVDAFSHMDKTGLNLDHIPLERFCGEAKRVSIFDVLPKGIGLIFNETLDLACFDKIKSASPNFVVGDLSETLERKLLQSQIVTYTGLINLNALPLKETVMFYGFPLNITSGDGSPVRAVAIIH